MKISQVPGDASPPQSGGTTKTNNKQTGLQALFLHLRGGHGLISSPRIGMVVHLMSQLLVVSLPYALSPLPTGCPCIARFAHVLPQFSPMAPL